MIDTNIIITRSKLLEKLGIIHGFTQRTGGVSQPPVESLNVKKSPLIPDAIENVAKNIETIMANELSVTNGILLYLEGGNNVISVDECSGYKTLYGYDGVATNQNNCFLAITVADCLPILLVDEAAGVIGISHAGWKGSVGKVTTKVIEQMMDLGAMPQKIGAVIGPGICGDCYEVGEDVTAEFAQDVLKKKQDNKYLLNLAKTNIAELRSAGVETIENLNICTFENPDKFYSARKEAQTGRFLAYISL